MTINTLRPLTLNRTLNTLRHIHGPSFSESMLAPKFKPYFGGPRIEVRTTYPDGTTHVRRGRVGITTGRLPVFLLLPRSDSRSSSDILDDRDEIVRVIPDWRSRRWGPHHLPSP
jgi:hypothetical protein